MIANLGKYLTVFDMDYMLLCARNRLQVGDEGGGGRHYFALNLIGLHAYLFVLLGWFSDINECLRKPCLNGGSCTDQFNKYSCTCMPGYRGFNCQTGQLKYSSGVFCLFSQQI